MRHRLADWGYEVSTGPLVWNRYKDQLVRRPGGKRFPLIWAEAVTSDGKFVWRADKKNHAPYFEVRNGDDWLITNCPCVLVQRTTAKEQNSPPYRRSSARELHFPPRRRCHREPSEHRPTHQQTAADFRGGRRSIFE